MKISYLIAILLTCGRSYAQDTLYLTCPDAISIALGESYSIRSYEVERQAMQQYFSYYKAMFKPRLDLALNTPVWQESLTTIEQANGPSRSSPVSLAGSTISVFQSAAWLLIC